MNLSPKVSTEEFFMCRDDLLPFEETSVEQTKVSAYPYFPPEILLKIFSYLTTKELILNASSVCKQWNTLAHDPSLWTEVFIIGNYITDKDVHSLVFRCKNLKKISIVNRTEADVALKTAVAAHFWNIEELEVINCSFFVSVKDITAEICKCKRLTSFTIRNTFYVDPYVLMFGDDVLDKALKKQQNSSFMNYMSISEFHDIVSNCWNLQKISLIHALVRKLDNDEFEAKFQEICSKLSKQLKILEFDASSFQGRACMRALSKCQKLQVLNLHNALRIGDDSIRCLRRLKRLENLTVSKGFSISLYGWRRLFENNGVPELKQLTIINPFVTDAAQIKKVVDRPVVIKVLSDFV